MLTKKVTQQLLKTGNWMIRFDNDGVAYGGFRWNPSGEWTIATNWKMRAKCGNGLHGQSINGCGYCQAGSRLVLCETDGKQIAIDGNKIKVKKAKIIAVNKDIPAIFINELLNHGGSLQLSSYNHPLPAKLKKRKDKVIK
jgi:hypothetical protein